MSTVKMKELLEAGVHFGHQTKRWNPKMKKYIFDERNGIYVIDLQKTAQKFKEASDFLLDVIAHSGTILFVGTKKQAKDSIKEESARCNMPHVTHRWLGGTLTNFATIYKSTQKLRRLEEGRDAGEWSLVSKKEALGRERICERLNKLLGGIKFMDRLPDAVFIIDPKKEKIAVHEANKLNIPVIAIVDTNCDPDPIDFVVPGNDDAIRAIKLFTSRIADTVLEGQQLYQEKAMTAEKEGIARREARVASLKTEDIVKKYSEDDDLVDEEFEDKK